MYVKSQRRVAMTLIEILVVIAIIAILASLLLGGVMVFMGKGPEVQNKNDILQLSAGLQKFKAKYKVYPPDTIKLCTHYSQYTAADAQSLYYLSVMFPNLGNFTNMDWANVGWATPAAVPNPAPIYYLEGDQCLVFFLGGIPTGPGGPPQGFSTNPNNPCMVGGDRIKFFDFALKRVLPVASSASRSAQFPSYIDAYQKGAPFMYFSSGKSTGAYTASSTLGVAPYRTSTGFFNPDTFQLISAGADGVFGAGGLWSPATATSMPQTAKDDMTNFHDKVMGIP